MKYKITVACENCGTLRRIGWRGANDYRSLCLSCAATKRNLTKGQRSKTCKA